MHAIHWYPGHMKKASNEMIEVIKHVDVVLELVDARAPKYTRNKFFLNVIKDKPHILVYMKSDLADLSKIKLEDDAVLVSIKNKNSLNKLIDKILLVNKAKMDKAINRGIKPFPPKVMIVGIPNIGKSSLINAFMNKKIAKVENRPGLTKSNRWINVHDKFYLLDTPGILPTTYEDSNYILALIGAIKIELLPIYELSEFAYQFMIKNYPSLFINRYKKIKDTSNESFEYIADIRGIKNDKSINHEKARSLFLKELRDGIIGKIYFDI